MPVLDYLTRMCKHYANAAIFAEIAAFRCADDGYLLRIMVEDSNVISN